MNVFRRLRAADAFTIANAALGFAAITYIADHNYVFAEVLILLAVLADGADGIVARRFGPRDEDLGDYLDIMADYLSFCVAPSILLYHLYYDVGASPLLTRPQDILVGLAAGLFALMGLLRLARHVSDGGGLQVRFRGLPTTGAGLFATLLVALGGLGDVLTALLVAAAAVLMVTEVPYPKVRGRAAAGAAVLVAAAAAALLLLPAGSDGLRWALLVALAGAATYAASGVLFALARVPLDGPPEEGQPAAESTRADGPAR
jgi:CDP-diacylglycerol--serine O-phosphatidyltransferase